RKRPTGNCNGRRSRMNFPDLFSPHAANRLPVVAHRAKMRREDIRPEGLCPCTAKRNTRAQLLAIHKGVNMLTRIFVAVFGLCLAIVATAVGQNYPTKPLTMVIPFAAGGPTDVLGRIVAQRMSEVLGQQVVVENVGGAGGMTG